MKRYFVLIVINKEDTGEVIHMLKGRKNCLLNRSSITWWQIFTKGFASYNIAQKEASRTRMDLKDTKKTRYFVQVLEM